MRRCQLAEGHTHRAEGQNPCNFRGGEGPGTMGERVVRRGVGERLPTNTTYWRVVQVQYPYGGTPRHVIHVSRLGTRVPRS